MNTQLVVDEEELELNEFVEKILSGMVAGAVTTLRGVKKDWKEIRITVSR